VAQSADLRWRRLYEAALLEVDQELLPRRVRVAKMAIHSRIISCTRWMTQEEFGRSWTRSKCSMTSLKCNETDLPRRA
jgi:hypothetical protein